VIWRQPGPITLVHSGKCILDPAGETLGCEQRRRLPLDCQMLLEAPQPSDVRSQLDRTAFVLFCRRSDQLGQPDRVQQAGGDAARKTRAELGQYGQACPQGIDGGGVRIERNRVEEQVSRAMSRQMVGEPRHSLCEYQALGTDAARGSLRPQTVRRPRRTLVQPEHAAVDLRKDAHPYVEHSRGDLVVVVEAAIVQVDVLLVAANGRSLEESEASGIADRDGLDEQVPFRDWQRVGMV
jgi:hypothetical protein